jgi:WD40 repeat protein
MRLNFFNSLVGILLISSSQYSHASDYYEQCFANAPVIREVAISPDDSKVLTISSEEQFCDSAHFGRLYDSKTGQQLFEVILPYCAKGLAFNKDGSKIAIGYTVADATNGKILFTLPQLPDDPGYIAFSDAGSLIYLARHNSVEVFMAETGASLYTIDVSQLNLKNWQLETLVKHGDQISSIYSILLRYPKHRASVAVSDSAQKIALRESESEELIVVDSRSGEIISKLRAAGLGSAGLLFSKNDQFLYVGTMINTFGTPNPGPWPHFQAVAEMFDITRGTLTYTTRYNQPIQAVGISPNSQMLLTIGNLLTDGGQTVSSILRIGDTNNGQVIKEANNGGSGLIQFTRDSEWALFQYSECVGFRRLP